MDYTEFAQALLSLIFVIGLIGVLVLVARRFGFGVAVPVMGSKNKRVVILEITTLDPKRRLVLIRRDNKEHLILLGMNGEMIVEGNIEREAVSFRDTLESRETFVEPSGRKGESQ